MKNKQEETKKAKLKKLIEQLIKKEITLKEFRASVKRPTCFVVVEEEGILKYDSLLGIIKVSRSEFEEILNNTTNDDPNKPKIIIDNI